MWISKTKCATPFSKGILPASQNENRKKKAELFQEQRFKAYELSPPHPTESPRQAGRGRYSHFKPQMSSQKGGVYKRNLAQQIFVCEGIDRPRGQAPLGNKGHKDELFSLPELRRIEGTLGCLKGRKEHKQDGCKWPVQSAKEDLLSCLITVIQYQPPTYSPRSSTVSYFHKVTIQIYLILYYIFLVVSKYMYICCQYPPTKM